MTEAELLVKVGRAYPLCRATSRGLAGSHRGGREGGWGYSKSTFKMYPVSEPMGTDVMSSMSISSRLSHLKSEMGRCSVIPIRRGCWRLNRRYGRLVWRGRSRESTSCLPRHVSRRSSTHQLGYRFPQTDACRGL